MLPIVGFQGTSLIDFPGKISSIIFIAGCNLRCPYCHNGTLFEFLDNDLIPEHEIFAQFEKRKKFIDGVVITGGEPTLYKDLYDFIKKLKDSFPFEIKLDSNGLNPDILEKLVPYVDYFSIDMKTVPEHYPSLESHISVSEVRKKLYKTRDLLQKQQDKHIEYRTTMYPPIVDSYETLYSMMEYIPANADYYLQRFIPETAWNEDARNEKTYEPEQLERMAHELRNTLNKESIYLRTYA